MSAVQIPLTQGRVAIVDDGDLPLIRQYKWCALRARNTYYAVTNGSISMHRVILGLLPGDKREGDHIDGDGLNNRRQNLRVVTHQQNMENRHGAQSTSWLGIRGLRTLTTPYNTYYVARVKKQGKLHQRYFPFTEQGKLDAITWLEALRKELFK